MASSSVMTHAQVEDMIRRTTGGTPASISERDRILSRRGSNARTVLNGLQRWLDSTARATQLAAERRRAIRLLVNLATTSNEVPDGHYLTGVRCTSLVPSWYGGFSDVHQATWSIYNVVVKRLRVNEGPDQMEIHKRLCIEGLTWRQLDHPHIVKFLGVFREEDEGRQRLSLVSVRIEDHLRNFLLSRFYNPRVDRKRLLIEIASALVYLHERGIAHGDVSLRNVLVDSYGKAFLTDFGLIAVGDGSTGHWSVQQGGAVQYSAPEFLFLANETAQDEEWPVYNTIRKPERPLKTTAGDVFAYGRLILAITLKDEPFGAIPEIQVLSRVQRGFPRSKPPSNQCHGAPMSDSLWELARACSRSDPNGRPRIDDVQRSLSAPRFDA